MAMKTEQTKVDELLNLARSDNTLFGLGIESRELSWSNFLAWLCDPTDRPEGMPELVVSSLLSMMKDELLDCLESTKNEELEKTLKLILPDKDKTKKKTKEISSVDWVKKEFSYEGKGRADVVIDVTIQKSTLRLVIENKIGAEERENQLADYIEAELKDNKEKHNLLPLLITLGHNEDIGCTLDWAAIVNRAELQEWFANVSVGLARLGIPIPRLIQDYLAYFRVLDLATDIEQNHQVMRELEKWDKTSANWQTLSRFMSLGDEHYFRRVIALLKKNGLPKDFDTKSYGSVLGRNEGMIIDKPTWILAPAFDFKDPDNYITGINVHLESRTRGRIQIDVEPEPYESWSRLKADPSRYEALKPLLDLKIELLKTFRKLADDQSYESFRASSTHLRNTETAGTCAAVYFLPERVKKNSELHAKDFDMPAVECAEHFGRVIERVTPIIEKVLDKHTKNGRFKKADRRQAARK